MRIFESLDELRPLVGQQLALSDWVSVTQQQIDLFAQATGDHQWIHVDVERARTGPFGSTIAHGYLTLSLLPKFLDTALEIRNMRMSLNYGLNRVRFTAPVPAGSRLRAAIALASLEPVAGGWQLGFEVTVQRDGADKPVCVAEALVRLHP